VGFNEGEVLEAFEQLPGGELQSLLTQLPFQKAVGQQSQHIEQKHSGNASVLMKVDGGDVQVALADVEPFFDPILFTSR
jgi:hypothetical protein